MIIICLLYPLRLHANFHDNLADPLKLFDTRYADCGFGNCWLMIFLLEFFFFFHPVYNLYKANFLFP